MWGFVAWGTQSRVKGLLCSLRAWHSKHPSSQQPCNTVLSRPGPALAAVGVCGCTLRRRNSSAVSVGLVLLVWCGVGCRVVQAAATRPGCTGAAAAAQPSNSRSRSKMAAVCGSRVTAFQGTRVAAPRVGTATRGVTAAVMAKKGIHPEWFPSAPVVHKGVEVMTVGGTKAKYNVDIYSGNHPFYQGNKSSNMIVDEGQLNKFKKRFADLEELSIIPVLQVRPGGGGGRGERGGDQIDCFEE